MMLINFLRYLKYYVVVVAVIVSVSVVVVASKHAEESSFSTQMHYKTLFKYSQTLLFDDIIRCFVIYKENG